MLGARAVKVNNTKLDKLFPHHVRCIVLGLSEHCGCIEHTYTIMTYLLLLEVSALATTWRYGVTNVILWAVLRLAATRWQV
jgi:Na+/H+ antiporter NhaC